MSPAPNATVETYNKREVPRVNGDVKEWAGRLSSWLSTETGNIVRAIPNGWAWPVVAGEVGVRNLKYYYGDVRRYGAVPGILSDAKPYFDNCRDSVTALGLACGVTGGTITVIGSYRLSTFAFASGIRLTGSGTLTFVTGTNNTNLLTGAGLANVSIDGGITLDGDKTNHAVVAGAGRLIEWSTCTGVRIHDCQFKNSIRYAIHLLTCPNASVTANSFDSCYYAVFGDGGCDGSIFSDNQVTNADTRGVHFRGSNRCGVNDNSITQTTTSDAAYIGIEIFVAGGGTPSTGCVVSGNTLKGCRISISTSQFATIVANTIESAPAMGIEIVDADSCITAGNTVTNSGQEGIAITGSSHGVYSGNLIDTPGTGGGIRVQATVSRPIADAGLIAHNVIRNVTGTDRGITILNNGATSANNWTIDANVIDTVVDRAIIVSNASGCRISNNTLLNITHATKIDVTSGTSANNTVEFNSYPTPIVADNGDAAKTLTYSQSSPAQIWATVLTADRAVTLAISAATAGARFHIVRAASATGVFNLNVGTGPLKALGIGSWCDVEYTGSAWILTGAGAL